MLSSIEIERPRLTPVLTERDLGFVLEALAKPPYEPLVGASLKLSTHKPVFLLAMASVEKRSKLQALVFGPKCLGSGVMLNLSPELMPKNQGPSQTNEPSYVPAVPGEKFEFDTPKCPMRSLRDNPKFMKDHPVLHKGRRLLFIPLKNKNAGKELSAATIFRLICNTIVDSHASFEKSKSLPKTDKARKVREIATLSQLFVKVDFADCYES